MLIFDIGFNEGNFTRIVKHYYPNSTVIGVDGNPMYVDLHYKIQNYNNVDVIHAIVTDKNNELNKFHICDAATGVSSVNEDWIEKIRHKDYYNRTDRIINVRSVTLDYLIENFGIPDILKLDIEGAESMALEGLSHKVGLVTFEWSEDYIQDCFKCIRKLLSLGFTKFGYSSDTDGFDFNIEYKSWEELNFAQNIDVLRKERCGMFYAK